MNTQDLTVIFFTIISVILSVNLGISIKNSYEIGYLKAKVETIFKILNDRNKK